MVVGVPHMRPLGRAISAPKTRHGRLIWHLMHDCGSVLFALSCGTGLFVLQLNLFLAVLKLKFAVARDKQVDAERRQR